MKKLLTILTLLITTSVYAGGIPKIKNITIQKKDGTSASLEIDAGNEKEITIYKDDGSMIKIKK